MDFSTSVEMTGYKKIAAVKPRRFFFDSILARIEQRLVVLFSLTKLLHVDSFLQRFTFDD